MRWEKIWILSFICVRLCIWRWHQWTLQTFTFKFLCLFHALAHIKPQCERRTKKAITPSNSVCIIFVVAEKFICAIRVLHYITLILASHILVKQWIFIKISEHISHVWVCGFRFWWNKIVSYNISNIMSYNVHVLNVALARCATITKFWHWYPIPSTPTYRKPNTI